MSGRRRACVQGRLLCCLILSLGAILTIQKCKQCARPSSDFSRFLYAETLPPPFFSFAARCAGDLRCRFPALPSVRAEAARGSGLAVTLLAPLLYFSPASGQPRSFPHRPAWHPGPNPAHLQPWIYRCGGGFHRRRPRQPGDEVALTRRQHFPSRGGVDPDWSGCSLPSIATRKGAKSSRRCDVVRVRD
ncbi:unnamed protein product [Urochloa humidicola]